MGVGKLIVRGHEMLDVPGDTLLTAVDRWLADFENIQIRDEVRPLILKENARKLLKL